MVSFQFDALGETQVNRMLSRTTEKMADLRPFLDATAEMFREGLVEQFASEGARSKKWAPLSPIYAAWKAKRWGAKPILEASGRLQRSLTSTGGENIERRPGKDTLEFGTIVPYASYHQTGTKTMPQRKILDLTSNDRRATMKLLQRFLFTDRSMKGFVGGGE